MSFLLHEDSYCRVRRSGRSGNNLTLTCVILSLFVCWPWAALIDAPLSWTWTSNLPPFFRLHTYLRPARLAPPPASCSTRVPTPAHLSQACVPTPRRAGVFFKVDGHTRPPSPCIPNLGRQPAGRQCRPVPEREQQSVLNPAYRTTYQWSGDHHRTLS